MIRMSRYVWPVALLVGLLAGLIIGRLLPETPAYAVATDRIEDFAVATGFVDEDVEAIYFLDTLTGTLKAGVVSNQNSGFQAHYEANLNADLKALVEMLNGQIRQTNQASTRGGTVRPEIQFPQTPNYLLVTGQADLRRTTGMRTRPSPSMVYVAETNTGIVMAYVLPWDAGAHSSNTPYAGKLALWAGEQFTTALIRSP